MRALLVSLLLGISCCVSNTSEVISSGEYHLARVTYYYPQPPYGSKVACSQTKYAKEGITVAAHPDFKFGTKIYIPELKNAIDDGYFVVQDRGPAVTRKSAAKGRGYVFDVYVNSRQKLQKLTATKPMFMKIYIVSP